MNDSYKLATVFGIEVRVHVLFLYMAALLVFLGGIHGSALGTAAFLAMLFGLVLLHELGHSLMAQRFGIRVLDIVLWPLGGMARMSEIPEDPKVEGWVAVAGPLVNVALAGVGALALLGTSGLDELFHDPLAPDLRGVQSLLALFVVVNAILGVFNLVPAFPMDGGRILRAWLARKRSWLEATEIAVRVGRVLAWAMILSIFLPTRQMNCAVPLIGLFVLWTGARELWATRMRHAAEAGFAFPGTAGAGPGAFTVHELFRAAMERRAAAGYGPRGRGPAGHTGAPEGGEPPPSGPGVGGVQVERGPAGGRGFSDEDVRRLEEFPGRLRRPPRDQE